MKAWTKRTERTGGAAGAARAQKRTRAPKREAEAVEVVRMRVTADRKKNWVRAAKMKGLSLTDWITMELDWAVVVLEK